MDPHCLTRFDFTHMTFLVVGLNPKFGTFNDPEHGLSHHCVIPGPNIHIVHKTGIWGSDSAHGRSYSARATRARLASITVVCSATVAIQYFTFSLAWSAVWSRCPVPFPRFHSLPADRFFPHQIFEPVRFFTASLNSAVTLLRVSRAISYLISVIFSCA